MALIKCKNCGAEISEQAVFCPHCGTKTELGNNSYGSLTFKWKGKWMVVDTDIYLELNGRNVGERSKYSFTNGFSVETAITTENNNISVKAGLSLPTRGSSGWWYLINDNFNITFEKGKNYTCNFSFSRISGGFSYDISEENGKIIYKKGLSKGRKIMLGLSCVIIALVLLGNIFKSVHLTDNHRNEFVETETAEAETDEKEDSETAAKRNILGTYQFGEYGANCEITINEDGTCTMFEEQTPKYLWHGTWKYHEWSDYNCYVIQWSSCDNPLLHLPFTYTTNYINEGINYIYANMTAMEAKDPNARYELNRR